MGGLTFNGQVTADATSGLGGDTVADFLLGVPKGLEVDSPPLNQSGIQKSFYAYVEDNWHNQRRLTLNLGVRLASRTSPSKRHGRTFPSPQVCGTISGQSSCASPNRTRFVLAYVNGLAVDGFCVTVPEE